MKSVTWYGITFRKDAPAAELGHTRYADRAPCHRVPTDVPLSGIARGNNGVATLKDQLFAAVRYLRCSTRKLPMRGRRSGK